MHNFDGFLICLVLLEALMGNTQALHFVARDQVLSMIIHCSAGEFKEWLLDSWNKGACDLEIGGSK